MNRNRARSAVSHGDVAGPSQHFKVDWPTHLKRTIKGSNDRSKPRQRGSQNKNQRANRSTPTQGSVIHSAHPLNLDCHPERSEGPNVCRRAGAKSEFKVKITE